MDKEQLMALLEAVRRGETPPSVAAEQLQMAPFENLRYARVDHHRGIRQGVPEVIYGEGKTAEQIVGILGAMEKERASNVLVTRLSKEKAEKAAAGSPSGITRRPGWASAGPGRSKTRGEDHRCQRRHQRHESGGRSGFDCRGPRAIG